MYEFDFETIRASIPVLISGIKITLLVSVVSTAIALLAGIFTAFFRSPDYFIRRYFSVFYVEITRNTPFLVQLYIYYKGLPNIGLNLNPVICGIIALGLYTGAFISEIIRSGINSIHKEQYDAARSLGLSRLQTFRHIIFPQAIRIIIPPLGSQIINLIKNSSLVSFIAVSDVFYVIYKGALGNFRFIEFFITGAAVYMLLCGAVAIVFNFIEHKIKISGRMAAL